MFAGVQVNTCTNVWRFFSKIETSLSLKNAWLPQIFFLDSKRTC